MALHLVHLPLRNTQLMRELDNDTNIALEKIKSRLRDLDVVVITNVELARSLFRRLVRGLHQIDPSQLQLPRLLEKLPKDGLTSRQLVRLAENAGSAPGMMPIPPGKLSAEQNELEFAGYQNCVRYVNEAVRRNQQASATVDAPPAEPAEEGWRGTVEKEYGKGASESWNSPLASSNVLPGTERPVRRIA